MNSRTLPVVAILFAAVASLPAEEPSPVTSAPVATAAALRSDQELDELLGPVALYPDALIAVILPAATRSTEIVLAARFLRDGGKPELLDEQPWDESVRSLAHHPDVIKWLDTNLAWTAQVGEAFLAQPAEVMKSVQRLRARARAAGTLTDTPQQKVLVEETEVIRIVPANPEIIYVPRYDPEIVYIERRSYYPDPFITFGFGYTVGSWLSYDCDWRHWRLHVVDRGWNWRSQPAWCHNRFYHGPVFQPAYWRPWTPPRSHVRHDYVPDRNRPRPSPVRPTRFVDTDRHRPPHLDDGRPDHSGNRDRRPDFDRPGRRPGSDVSDTYTTADRQPGGPSGRRGNLSSSATMGFAGAPVVPPVATPVVPPVTSEVFVPGSSGRPADSGRRNRPVETGSRVDYRARETDGNQRGARTYSGNAAPHSLHTVPAPATRAQVPTAAPMRIEGGSSRRNDEGRSGAVSAPPSRPRAEPSSGPSERSRRDSSSDRSPRGERYERSNQDR